MAKRAIGSESTIERVRIDEFFCCRSQRCERRLRMVTAYYTGPIAKQLRNRAHSSGRRTFPVIRGCRTAYLVMPFGWDRGMTPFGRVRQIAGKCRHHDRPRRPYGKNEPFYDGPRAADDEAETFKRAVYAKNVAWHDAGRAEIAANGTPCHRPEHDGPCSPQEPTSHGAVKRAASWANRLNRSVPVSRGAVTKAATRGAARPSP